MTPQQTTAIQRALDALTILGDAQDKEVRPGIWHRAKGWEAIEALQSAKAEQPAPVQQEPEQCTWTQVDDEHTPDTWQADCCAMWTFTDGGPKDNDMHYCPKCGKPTIETAHGITKGN